MRIETQFTSLRASKSCWSGFFSNLQIRVHLSKRSNRFSFTTSTLHQQSVTRPDLFTQNDGIPSSDPDPERIEHSPFSSSSSSSDQISDSALPKGSYVYKSQKRHSPATTPELEETLRPYEERWRGNPFCELAIYSSFLLRRCLDIFAHQFLSRFTSFGNLKLSPILISVHILASPLRQCVATKKVLPKGALSHQSCNHTSFKG